MKILVTGGSGFIGTNFIDGLKQNSDIQISNVDIAKPKIKSHEEYWEKIDILEKEDLINHLQRFAPDFIIHFAALTDCDPRLKLDDYKVNTEGTQNLLEAIRSAPSVSHFIFVSSQYVNQAVGLPKHDQDYAPHTIYGSSKIIGEQMLRAETGDLTWTIVRPTNVWGPWHIRYPYEFWKVLKEGKYIHPGRKKVIRSYGYVKNVCDQISQILKLEKQIVDKQVFYVGDEALDLYDWVNEFSKQLLGRKVRVMPRFIIWPIALLGTVLFKFNVKFPLTLSRYKSMTTNDPAPMEKTIMVLGEPKYNLVDGVSETVSWLKSELDY